MSNRTARKRRAAVLVEYALLLTFVAIPTMMGIAAGGIRMLQSYRNSRSMILAPTP
jgi:hypothetical protein